MPPRRIEPTLIKAATPKPSTLEQQVPTQKKTLVPENAEYLAVKNNLTVVGDGVEILPSTLGANAGYGLFATRSFAKGAPVTEYIGTIISHDDARKLSKEDRSHVRAHQLQRTAINGKIVGGRPISAAVLQGKGGGAMTNHKKKGAGANVVFAHADSARYNAELDNWMANSNQSQYPDPRGRITYMQATRAIKKGEELFVDYGNTYWAK